MHKKEVTLSAKRGQRKMWGRHSSCRKPCGKEHRKSWGNRCPSFLQFLVVVTVSNLPVPLSLCQSLGDSRIIPSRKLRQKPIKCMGTSATVYGSTKLWVFRVGFWKNGKFAHFCKKGGDYWRNCRSVTLVSLLKKNLLEATPRHRVGGDPTCIYQGRNTLYQPVCLLWWDCCLGEKGPPWS